MGILECRGEKMKLISGIKIVAMIFVAAFAPRPILAQSPMGSEFTY